MEDERNGEGGKREVCFGSLGMNGMRRNVEFSISSRPKFIYIAEFANTFLHFAYVAFLIRRKEEMHVQGYLVGCSREYMGENGSK